LRYLVIGFIAANYADLLFEIAISRCPSGPPVLRWAVQSGPPKMELYSLTESGGFPLHAEPTQVQQLICSLRRLEDLLIEALAAQCLIAESLLSLFLSVERNWL